MKSLISIFLIVIGFSLNSFSSCGEKKNVLFFANGMFNTRKDARYSLAELKKRSLQENLNAAFENYEIAYYKADVNQVKVLSKGSAIYDVIEFYVEIVNVDGTINYDNGGKGPLGHYGAKLNLNSECKPGAFVSLQTSTYGVNDSQEVQSNSVNLQSASGTKVSLNFQPVSANSNMSSWISVGAYVQLANAYAQAQTVTLIFVSNCAGTITSTTFSMAPTGGSAFTDRGNRVIIPTGSAAGACTQELAVHVGNDWLKDSYNPYSSNFKFSVQ